MFQVVLQRNVSNLKNIFIGVDGEGRPALEIICQLAFDLFLKRASVVEIS